MGTLIEFRRRENKNECLNKRKMCPGDWAKPYNPTYEELRMTLKSLEECHGDAMRQLSTAGVQSEFILRDRIQDLEKMRTLLMDYYKED